MSQPADPLLMLARLLAAQAVREHLAKQPQPPKA